VIVVLFVSHVAAPLTGVVVVSVVGVGVFVVSVVVVSVVMSQCSISDLLGGCLSNTNDISQHSDDVTQNFKKVVLTVRWTRPRPQIGAAKGTDLEQFEARARMLHGHPWDQSLRVV
jgi:hypothetical protein